MKYKFCFFTILIILSCDFLYSKNINSTKNYSVDKYPISHIKDTNVIYDDFRCYVIKAKVLEECNCNFDMYHWYVGDVKYDTGNISMKFVKVQILERVKDFSADKISDSLLFNIQYLHIPKDTTLPLDSTFTLLVDREYSYDYLVFVARVSDRTTFKHYAHYIGNSFGLQPMRKESIPFIAWLFEHKMISINIANLFYQKHKNQKNIERCLKKLGGNVSDWELID